MTNLKFKDVKLMTNEELQSHVIYLRGILQRKLTFWGVIDRLFRWRIIQIYLENPLHYGSVEEQKDKYIKIIDFTDNVSFSFEDLLDKVINAVNKSVFKTAKMKPSDFIIKTKRGVFSIKNMEG